MIDESEHDSDDIFDPIVDDIRWDETALPSDDDIIAYIETAPQSVTKKDIAKHFKIKGANRQGLKKTLRRLEKSGVIDTTAKRIKPAGSLPEVLVLLVTGTDNDGELLATPVDTDHQGDHTIYVMVNTVKRQEPPTIGDKILARLHRTDANTYDASIIRVLKSDSPQQSIVGIYNVDDDGTYILPTDKKDRNIYLVLESESHNPKHGDIVVADPIKQRRRHYGPKAARIREIVGDMNDPRAFSLIAIHKNGIPTDFSDDVINETQDMTVPPLGNRDDLRKIPLVTIDGADARDFDDAVFAEKWDEKGKNGWHMIVAIADVTHYVTPNSALDNSAQERGNSVYFPDRVVPMLPEKLSNDLCSLRPDGERACLAVHLWVDNDGQLQDYKFVRGLMHSHARLTYEQVQMAQDGHPDDTTAPLMDTVITPLYQAYQCLNTARENRGTLDLEIPERQVEIDREVGEIKSITPRARLDSHKMIEEFMVLANVASALALEKKKMPAMYRIHEPPTLEKLEMLRDGLSAMGYDLDLGTTIAPRLFTGILKQAEEDGKSPIVSELILRSQCRAVYSPDNQGHFGLALPKYCHFTSPIRRYADVLVHRALLTGWGLSDNPKTDGLPPEQAERFENLGNHISITEQRAVNAERDAMNRYLSAYMIDKVDATFPARISGITSAGLFITLDETGADGLIPIRTLPQNDYYILDKTTNTIIGEKTGIMFQMGQMVNATLMEVNIATGTMAFEINEDTTELTKTKTRPKKQRLSPRRDGRRSYNEDRKPTTKKPTKKKKKTTPKHKRKQKK